MNPEPAQPARDLVVYASGGGMRGIFGAGALHALAGAGLRDRVRAIYGISAGALNGAQFALGSTMAAAEWYLHHVIEHGDRKSTRLNSSHEEVSRMPSELATEPESAAESDLSAERPETTGVWEPAATDCGREGRQASAGGCGAASFPVPASSDSRSDPVAAHSADDDGRGSRTDNPRPSGAHSGDG